MADPEPISALLARLNDDGTGRLAYQGPPARVFAEGPYVVIRGVRFALAMTPEEAQALRADLVPAIEQAREWRDQEKGTDG